MTELENRRPLRSRNTSWAQTLAKSLAQAGISPDAISFAGVVFAVLGCGALVFAGTTDFLERTLALLAAAACIQLRLLCNLLDGMVAVEHGKGSPYGPIWNELPDRIADTLFLVGTGYWAAGTFVGFELFGWCAAALAILTAYIRELGRGLGFAADFCGPMAKPHRMAALTVACVLGSIEEFWFWRGESAAIVLLIIIAGTALTAARRTWRLGEALKYRAP